jgi:hypothetical protein
VREFWEEGNFVERFAGTFDFVCRVACILWEHSFVAVIFGFRSESAMIRRNEGKRTGVCGGNDRSGGLNNWE